jgi:hypothetical protein
MKDTNIDRALDLAAAELSAHSEMDVPKIVILLTDGV